MVFSFFHKDVKGKDGGRKICLYVPSFSFPDLCLSLEFFTDKKVKIKDKIQGTLVYHVVKHEKKRMLIDYISKITPIMSFKSIQDFNSVIDSEDTLDNILIQDVLIEQMDNVPGLFTYPEYDYDEKDLLKESYYIDFFLSFDFSKEIDCKRWNLFVDYTKHSENFF